MAALMASFQNLPGSISFLSRQYLILCSLSALHILSICREFSLTYEINTRHFILLAVAIYLPVYILFYWHNAPHHLPAKAGEARCSRSGACGCWAAISVKRRDPSSGVSCGCAIVVWAPPGEERFRENPYANWPRALLQH